MTENRLVTCSLENGIATVVLNRPEKRNAMNKDLAEAFQATLADLARRHDCHIVVFRGAGGHFCAGGDLQDFQHMLAEGPDAVEPTLVARRTPLLDVASLPQVTVAAVQGLCLGGGFSLVTHCDLALASASARFGLPEIKVGMLPGIVMLDAQLMMPRKNALEWLLTGGTYGADEALRLGVVGRVVPDDHFESALAELTGTLAAQAPAIVRATKALYRDTERLDLESATRLAVKELRHAVFSPDTREGVASFLERRKPVWRSLA